VEKEMPGNVTVRQGWFRRLYLTTMTLYCVLETAAFNTFPFKNLNLLSRSPQCSQLCQLAVGDRKEEPAD